MTTPTVNFILSDIITSVHVEDGVGHDHISVWVNHGLSGTLVTRKEETARILHILGCRKENQVEES